MFPLSLFVDNNKVTRARIPNEGEDTGNKDASGKTIGAGFYNLANCQNHKNDVFFSDNFELAVKDYIDFFNRQIREREL